MKAKIKLFSLILICGFFTLFTVFAAAGKVSEQRQKLITYSLKFQGTPYRSGGQGPDTFDCSGFVNYVFNYGIGIQLPRTAMSMYEKCTPIDSSKREPGDLVFFWDKNISGTRITHVGIYCGKYNGKNPKFAGKRVFISCISDGPRTGVQLELMDADYWKKNLYAYGRVIPSTAEYNSNLKQKDFL